MSQFICALYVFMVLKGASFCRYETFNNTSVTITGFRGPSTINGCFGPGKKLEKASLIQILNETVPVLYEDAFNNLENLVDIILENDKITEIQPGAFRNLPKLFLIRIKFNNISIISAGVFKGLQVNELNLISNNIRTVHSEAFDDMVNLQLLLIGDNKIKKWDPVWFKGTPNLNTINFENNIIEELPIKAFQFIKEIHQINHLNVSTTIHLNNNLIKEIGDGAFDGLNSLGWLFLQHNQIEDFNVNSLGNLKQLDWLRLDFNRLKCIPEKLLEIAPTCRYYLEGNPLEDQCTRKFNITRKI